MKACKWCRGFKRVAVLHTRHGGLRGTVEGDICMMHVFGIVNDMDQMLDVEVLMDGNWYRMDNDSEALRKAWELIEQLTKTLGV